MNPVLFIIDMQAAFFKGNGESVALLNEAVQEINKCIELFREKHLPIIAVRQILNEIELVPGKSGFITTSLIKLDICDKRINKTYKNAFTKTELNTIVKELKVDTIIITGYSAEFCILSTYRGAEDLDYTPLILSGAIAGQSRENVKFVEEINNVISLEELKERLGS